MSRWRHVHPQYLQLVFLSFIYLFLCFIHFILNSYSRQFYLLLFFFFLFYIFRYVNCSTMTSNHLTMSSCSRHVKSVPQMLWRIRKKREKKNKMKKKFFTEISIHCKRALYELYKILNFLNNSYKNLVKLIHFLPKYGKNK